MAPRETENNAYAKFWGDKQRTLWYVTVFLEWSIVHSKTQIKFPLLLLLLFIIVIFIISILLNVFI